MTISLGTLERVDSLRLAWPNEARDFTPWLALEENLAMLGDVLGLQLELVATEKGVGPFSADILCRDSFTDRMVVIENQLESSDHKHLGQIMTYAAGLDALTVVWIARKILDEHRAALDWINENSVDELAFYGLEIELWRIGDSQPAPKFNVVCRPNEFSREGNRLQSGSNEDLTPAKAFYLEYWTQFKQFLDQSGSRFSFDTPRAHNEAWFRIGRPSFSYYAAITKTKNQLSVGLHISGRHVNAYSRLLEQDREAIEAEIGCPINWWIAEDHGWKVSYLQTNNTEFDVGDQANWPRMHAWHARMLEACFSAFDQRTWGLNPSDYQRETD